MFSAPVFIHVFNTFPLCDSILLHITLLVLFYLYVWIINWVVTDIWWKFQVNSIFINISTEKNGDVFNAYFIIFKKKIIQQYMYF